MPFDRIMHFIAVAAIAALFYQYIYSYEKDKMSKFSISIISILIASGIGSLMEIIEFVGYSYLGKGEGLLFYGTGDFGEWNNLSWDLISNTFGAITSVIVMSIFYSRKAIKKQIKKLAKLRKHKKHLKIFYIIIPIILVALLTSQISEKNEIDPHASYDFDHILNLASVNKTTYLQGLETTFALDNSNFAKGDAYLILGRLTKNTEMLCKSADFYAVVENTLEEKALAYETIASLDCRENSKEYYLKASKIWKIIGNQFRADIDKKLSNEEDIEIIFAEYEIPKTIKKPNTWNTMFIGSSSIELDENSVLVSQTDRVSRDWLSFQIQKPSSNNLLSTFSERLSYNETELMPEIGWHEGARIKETLKVGLTHKIASGTIVAKINNIWYAPDENGIFRFEIPEDKLMYPTTRYLSENLAIVIDTHGANMLVEQAIRNNASAVLACCDHPGKIKAAKYLSDKGISVICLTDRFVPDLLFSKVDVLGSPPIKIENNKAIIGAQQISINKNEKIIVMDIDSTSIYAIQYYDTPARYFKNLEQSISLNLEYVEITDFNQMYRLIEKAEQENANIIAARIFNSNDYKSIKEWLKKDKDNRAILFHSVSYPYGYKLMQEFPQQTTFDDINPTII
jgi:hypothetical protein